MKRPSILTTLEYDPMDPMNIADRALDPDDGIDYEQLIAEIIEDERAGNGFYFENGEGFDEWLHERFNNIISEIKRDIACRPV